VFRPLAQRTTAVLYFAQTLDLPPRPAASYLRGPFTRVNVHYQSIGVLPKSNHRYNFTIVWPATIARLVAAINRPTRIWVLIGSGGTVLFSESAELSFIRQDSGVRKVSVGGVLDRIIVGHTHPVADINARVIKLVARIAHRRCRSAESC
jgi:hypothetical protein